MILKAQGTTNMPDMTGWSLTDAQSFAKQIGFTLTWKGSGYITSQTVGANQLVVKSSQVAIVLKEKE